jgi:omega-6 fatty acid desaturase (delta-12 desaturase)
VNEQRPADWSRNLARYRRPSAGRSIAFLAGWWWLALLLTIPAGGFLVRLFMIQHDCGHGSFFEARAANDWVGRVLGLFTLTPYDYWRRTHAMHHATSGNLDRRGLGAIETLTVEEYLALPRARRLGYRLYRHPLVLFGLGPTFNFLLAQRLPLGLMRDRAAWISVLGNSLFTLAGLALLAWLIGSAPVLSVNLLTMLIAGTIGVWLFFVQHQFEGVAWARNGEWKREEAALHGSSHLDLPPVLRWMTANIGVHHVHHLSSRIPFYRLPDVLRDFPHLKPLSRLTIADTVGCARLALWHEAERRMVSFKDLKSLRPASALAA